MAFAPHESDRLRGILLDEIDRLDGKYNGKYNDILTKIDMLVKQQVSANIDTLVKQQVEEAMPHVFDRVDIQKRLAKVFQDTEFAQLKEDVANLKTKSNSISTFPSAPPKAASEARQHHISKNLLDKTFKSIQQDWDNQPDTWERRPVSDFITEWWKNYTWNDPILVSLQQNNPTTYEFTQKKFAN